MTKHEISRIFDEIALLLQFKGDNPYKSRAYYNAARTIEDVTEEVSELVATGRIRELQGIGPALSEKLAEIVGTGRCLYYEELKQGIPPGVLEMASLSGVGPKKALLLWQELGVSSIGELEYACIENRLAKLKGFGQKTQDKVRQAILKFKRRRGFYLYAHISEEADRLCTVVQEAPGVTRAELVGDLRRKLEVVQSISLVAAADNPRSIFEALQRTGTVETLEATNGIITGTGIRGIPVSIVVMPHLTPHALLAATGSPSHLAELATRAAHKGILWNLDAPDAAAPPAETEEALYAVLQLPYIEPELREGMGEIEEAEAGRLSSLLEPRQIQGIFHNHTTYSDGAASLEEMVAGARERGFHYIGISDHSQSAFYANGLKEDRIRLQHAAIDALRGRFPQIAILKGIEADILPDGSMDYPDEVLARFDFVIGSVHSRFNLPEPEQTARVVRALANPYVTMLGHASGRLLLSRDGYSLDMKQVIEAARTHGKVIEINANPYRLDLDWRVCRSAKAQGVRFSVNPDAHSVEELGNVPFGVNVARKAGLSASDVINTLDAKAIQAVLQHIHRPHPQARQV
jgi:DNA polymerase (family 10)